MPPIPPEGLLLCNLGKIMHERRLTVTQVARLTGLSRPTVRKLREGRINSVSAKTIAKLCTGLHLGVGVLFAHRSRNQLRAERRTRMGASEP